MFCWINAESYEDKSLDSMILLRLLILLSTRKMSKSGHFVRYCMDWLILCDSKDYSEGLAWHYGVFTCGFLEREKHEEREDSVGEGNGCKKGIICHCFIISYQLSYKGI